MGHCEDKLIIKSEDTLLKPVGLKPTLWLGRILREVREMSISIQARDQSDSEDQLKNQRDLQRLNQIVEDLRANGIDLEKPLE